MKRKICRPSLQLVSNKHWFALNMKIDLVLSFFPRGYGNMMKRVWIAYNLKSQMWGEEFNHLSKLAQICTAHIPNIPKHPKAFNSAGTQQTHWRSLTVAARGYFLRWPMLSSQPVLQCTLRSESRWKSYVCCKSYKFLICWCSECKLNANCVHLYIWHMTWTRKDMLRFMLTATLQVAAIDCCLQRLQYLGACLENLFSARLKCKVEIGHSGFVQPFKVSRWCCFVQELHMQDNHDVTSTESLNISPWFIKHIEFQRSSPSDKMWPVSTWNFCDIVRSTELEVATLTVSNGFTLSAGDFDASGSTGTFKTSSGANSLNGPTPRNFQTSKIMKKTL